MENIFKDEQQAKVLSDALDLGWRVRIDTQRRDVNFSYPYPQDLLKDGEPDEDEIARFLIELLPPENYGYGVGHQNEVVPGFTYDEERRWVRWFVLDVLPPLKPELLDALSAISKRILEEWQPED